MKPMSKNKNVQPAAISSNKKETKSSKPRLLKWILVGGGLSIALSLRFSESAHAASSVPPPYVNVNRVRSSSKPNFLGSTEKPDSISGSTSIVNLHKDIPLDDSSRFLNRIQNRNKKPHLPLVSSSSFLGTRFLEGPQMSQRSSNQNSGTAHSSLPDPLNFDIDVNQATKDFTKSNLDQKLVEYNITMDNSTSQIPDSHIRGMIFISARELANCKLSHPLEARCIAKAMHKLRIHQINSQLTKNQLEILRQKTWGLQFLLRENLKKVDSYNNKLTYGFENTMQNFSFSNDDCSDWSPVVKEKFDNSLQTIKLKKADEIEYLFDEYIQDQSCNLSLQVYKEVPEHFLKQYYQLCHLYNHYWKFRNHSNSLQYRNHFLKMKQKQKNPPSNLIEAVSIDADQLIKQESVIDHYNKKYKANYKLNYINQTGREPNLFDSWIDEVSKPLLTSMSTENTNFKPSNEEGYLRPPSIRDIINYSGDSAQNSKYEEEDN
uniref:hypothetical protein n=1 Tax=Klebsormidium nitens TaxID=105231 RepID=UPI00286C24FA|nr:hypothetical protein RMD58_pgp001 [Klebsormidium nitens]WKT07233.1 hypothetical protein [Klebsormidium nitens]